MKIIYVKKIITNPVFVTFLLFFLCNFSWVFAQNQQPIFVMDKPQATYDLSGYTYFLADSTQQFSLEEVKQPEFWQKMQVYSQVVIENQDVKVGCAYWYKIQIVNQLKTKTEFIFEPNLFGETAAYYFNANNQLLKSLKAGRDVSPKERASHLRTYSLPLSLAYGDTLCVVVKAIAKIELEAFAPPVLQPQATFYGKLMGFTFPQLFFQGAMLIMFFYNLLFFFVVRDKAYLYYALYIFCMAAVSADNYLLIDYEPAYVDRLINFSALFITLFYTQFIRYFLNIAFINPVLNHYCNYWAYSRTVLVLCAIGFYFGNSALLLNNKFVLLVFITDILLGLWLIYKSWRANPRLATYIVLGYMAMTFPLAVAILQQIFFDVVDAEVEGVRVQIGVLVELVLFSLGLGYRSKLAEKEKLKAVEENRQIIAQQNVVLEQKVQERTTEIQAQKEAIEKQNLGIRQNINYASRIQAAFLPKEETIGQYIDEFFIFFRPRDVVSGDFYFVEETQGKVVIAAIDCTGHGVSGAFMTMLGNEILRNLVDNQLLTSPDILLNELHKAVRQALKQQNTENKDGMDLSILVVDKQQKIVEFAGAKNPAFYIQNGELAVLKADKMPIGGEQREQERIFTKTTIDISQPTTFYLFSDGYQDQFGGEQDKKFMLAAMKKMFLEIYNLPMREQEQKVATAFDKWKGGREQTDDVLVVGIRI